MLTQIQREWDEIGRIFGRDQERSLDDGMRRIEQALRGREDADWKANDPRTKARANDMTQQLLRPRGALRPTPSHCSTAT